MYITVCSIFNIHVLLSHIYICRGLFSSKMLSKNFISSSVNSLLVVTGLVYPCDRIRWYGTSVGIYVN